MVDLGTMSGEFLRLLEGRFEGEERARIKLALETAIEAHHNQTREDGSPYATHVIAVAMILLDWGVDAETVIAGLLHDTIEDTPVTYQIIRQAFGRRVATLVEGVTKFTQADFAGQELDRKVETLRKLFEVMRSDIRVVLIKLADRLHNVRTIHTLPRERQKRFAEETLDVYYPLAYHLSLNDVRREYSDACVPIVYPEESALLTELREGSRARWEGIEAQAEQEISAADTERLLKQLILRPRSLYSLHIHRALNVDKNPYYLVAIVPDTEGCYRFLKLLHTVYRPIGGGFRDFIAAPTESGYQSLHTVVVGPGGERAQFRIRTPVMEAVEARGVLLKRFGTSRDALPGFEWLERSETLDLATRESSESFWRALQSDILRERFAATIDGHPVNLPRGATALDAIYARYGPEGNRVKQVTVNGTPHPLSTPLGEDDVLQVVMDATERVEFDWLGAISTRYARGIITDALKRRDQSVKLTLGQRLLQKEFDHFQKGLVGELSKAQRQEIAEHFNRKSFDDVIEMIGEGLLRPADVVFTLFPERRPRWPWRRPSKDYDFRIRITGAHEREQDIHATVTSLARAHGVRISSTTMQSGRIAQTFHLEVRGNAKTRLQFADFLDALEHHEGISHIHALPSLSQEVTLWSMVALAITIVVLDVAFVPVYWKFIERMPFLLRFALQVVPILPMLAVNTYILGLLQRYILALRRDRWYLGLGFFLNMFAILLMLTQSHLAGTAINSLLPFAGVLFAAMLYLGYRFLQNELLLDSFRQTKHEPIPAAQWAAIKRKKIVGYIIRLFAVIVWGMFPLYLKYTPANQVPPFPKVFLISLGGLGVTLLLLAFKCAWRPFSCKALKLPRNIYLNHMIIGQIGLLFFAAVSLSFTTSTNYLLLQNFGPVLALLIAVLLWRQSIPYLNHPRHILWVFIVFILGSTGSSFIILNSLQSLGPGSVQGDVLSLITMTFDTLLVIAQIRYLKLVPKASGPSINIHMFAAICVLFLPLLLVLHVLGITPLEMYLGRAGLYAMGAGALLGVGELLNYEAFRRIDGFIAFLMFNISILITFIIEVYFLEAFTPGWILLLGGAIIVGSTVAAEFINTKCEKQGL